MFIKKQIKSNRLKVDNIIQEKNLYHKIEIKKNIENLKQLKLIKQNDIVGITT